MLESAFEALGPMLESGDPASSLDYLIRQFRESKDYHLLFEARLMKKRLELGLPLVQAPNLGALPPDVQAKYQQFLVEAAQETGELFLANGDISKAWPYLRATGDVKRVAAAIEKVDPAENVEAIIEIAFMQGVHPAKGLELVIEKFGLCRALTYFGGNGGEKDREQCIGVLAKSIYSELAASLDNAIEEREGHKTGLTSIAELIEGRDWLFGEYSSYIDPSHVVSVLQSSPKSLTLKRCGNFMTSASTGSGSQPTSSSLAGRRLKTPSSTTITSCRLFWEWMLSSTSLTSERKSWRRKRRATGRRRSWSIS